MYLSRIAWLSLALATSLAAQTLQTFQLPTGSFAAGESAIPLASSPTRYQQWYSATDLQATVRLPARLHALAFLAGNVLQNGSTVDIEIRMAHLPPGQLPGAGFEANLARDNTLVFPRSVVTLALRPAPGARVFTFNFVRDFAWNGSSGIVIDLKVFGNGMGNQSYLYPCRTTVSSLSQTMRLFASGNPANLSTATTVQNGQGMVTEFDYLDGVSVSFGSGCQGTAGVVPVAGTSGGLPIPPNALWAQTLNGAVPQAPVVLVVGSSQTAYGTVPLPFDLGLIGFTGCFLRVEPLVYFPATATAAGVATVPMPLPGVTLRRRYMFVQWFVLDSGAPNGALAASQAMWHVFG